MIPLSTYTARHSRFHLYWLLYLGVQMYQFFFLQTFRSAKKTIPVAVCSCSFLQLSMPAAFFLFFIALHVYTLALHLLQLSVVLHTCSFVQLSIPVFLALQPPVAVCSSPYLQLCVAVYTCIFSCPPPVAVCSSPYLQLCVAVYTCISSSPTSCSCLQFSIPAALFSCLCLYLQLFASCSCLQFSIPAALCSCLCLYLQLSVPIAQAPVAFLQLSMPAAFFSSPGLLYLSKPIAFYSSQNQLLSTALKISFSIALHACSFV